MTMTETRPVEAQASAPPTTADESHLVEPSGLAGWLVTRDHKRVGRLFGGSALLVLLGVAVVAALLAVESIDGDGTQLLRDDTVAQLTSFVRWGLVVGVVLPLLLGVALAVVPLQVGARGIAFPRAAALGYWTWLVGFGLMVGAYLDNGGPGGGNADAVDLWLGALVVTLAGATLASVCVATTALTLRSPGMHLERVPPFTWSALVTAVMVVLALPVVAATAMLLWVDHHHARIVFGGNLEIGSYLDWAVEQPQVYLFAIPVLGFIAEVMATFTRHRLVLRWAVFLGVGAAGALTFAGWAQPAFAPEVRSEFLFVAANLVVVVPVLVALAVGAAMLARGRPAFGAPLVAALLSGFLLVVAVVAGALTYIDGLDLAGTAYVWGVSAGALLAGVVAGLGALAYWGPKLWGRRLADGPASGGIVLTFVGGLLVLAGAVLAGVDGLPLGAVDHDGGTLTQIGAVVGLAGWVLVLFGVVAVVALALRSFTGGDEAGDDPWDGQTLEWAVPSPAPVENLLDTVVLSPEPLLDRKLATKEPV
jgi:heme/copper-type cytochrome/quinol oxidase subunit 1